MQSCLFIPIELRTERNIKSVITIRGNLVAQNATITGVVTDSETKDFLIGATVME